MSEVTTHGNVWLVVCENPFEDYTVGIYRSEDDAKEGALNDFVVRFPDELLLWEQKEEAGQVGWIKGGGCYSIIPHDILGFTK